MTNAITSCSFSSKRLHDQAYQFTTSFYDKDSQKVSEVVTDYLGTYPNTVGKIVDVYSQNGCSFSEPRELLTDHDEAHLFSKHDIKGFKQAARKLGAGSEAEKYCPEADRTVFVLDLQDPDRTYLDPSGIKASEKVVCEFMRAPVERSALGRNAQKIHDILHVNKGAAKLPVDFVLREGSLKAELVKELTDDQASYFLNTGRSGRQAFCEYTEPFMTALKLGQTWRKGEGFNEMLVPISRPEEAFSPRRSSNVLYPEAYQELYAPTARIPKALDDVFSLSFTEDPELHITSMTIAGVKACLLDEPRASDLFTPPTDGVLSPGLTPISPDTKGGYSS